MKSDATELNPHSRKPRVLIIEDDKVAAHHLKNELEDRGCECLLLVCNHKHEFETELSRMYPAGQPATPEYNFQGTILDVMFKASGTNRETEGGRDLYKYLQYSENPNILHSLGIILVVSEHDDPKSVFKEIGALAGPNLRFSVKLNSRILRKKLDEFVADL